MHLHTLGQHRLTNFGTAVKFMSGPNQKKKKKPSKMVKVPHIMHFLVKDKLPAYAIGEEKVQTYLKTESHR